MDDKKVPGLTFVISTNPQDARSAANKRRVRSAAALKSWRDIKESETKLPKPSKRRKRGSASTAKGSEVSPTIKDGDALKPEEAPPVRDSYADPSSTTSKAPSPQPQPQPQQPLSPSPAPAPLPPPTSVAKTSDETPKDSTSNSPASSTRGVKRRHEDLQDEPQVSPPAEFQFTFTSQLQPSKVEPDGGNTTWTSSDDIPADIPQKEEPPHSQNSRRKPEVVNSSEDSDTPDLAQASSSKEPVTSGHINPHRVALVSSRSPSPCRAYCNDLEPFNCAPVPHKPWFDGILHHSWYYILLETPRRLTESSSVDCFRTTSLASSENHNRRRLTMGTVHDAARSR